MLDGLCTQAFPNQGYGCQGWFVLLRWDPRHCYTRGRMRRGFLDFVFLNRKQSSFGTAGINRGNGFLIFQAAGRPTEVSRIYPAGSPRAWGLETTSKTASQGTKSGSGYATIPSRFPPTFTFGGSVMTPIVIYCPACEARIRAPSQLIGEERKCPGCGHRFVVGAQPPKDQGPILLMDVLPSVKPSAEVSGSRP